MQHIPRSRDVRTAAYRITALVAIAQTSGCRRVVENCSTLKEPEDEFATSASNLGADSIGWRKPLAGCADKRRPNYEHNRRRGCGCSGPQSPPITANKCWVLRFSSPGSNPGAVQSHQTPMLDLLKRWQLTRIRGSGKVIALPASPPRRRGHWRRKVRAIARFRSQRDSANSRAHRSQGNGGGHGHLVRFPRWRSLLLEEC